MSVLSVLCQGVFVVGYVSMFSSTTSEQEAVGITPQRSTDSTKQSGETEQTCRTILLPLCFLCLLITRKSYALAAVIFTSGFSRNNMFTCCLALELISN